jgi:acyl-CoA synthetase (AMP-forming)/AMP-acid ligase II
VPAIPALLPAAVQFVRGLAAHGERSALITRDGELTYRELATRVDATARRLGSQRRLVLLAATNTVDSVVTYLAALSSGHPVLLVPGDRDESLRSLVAAYDPDVVAGPAGTGWMLEERRAGSRHDLHPDLALLLSTSGSTGSPKLVRLSHDNLQANADSIAEYLEIRSTDRAATTLPMHYCYGLSIVNSHLLRGAALILTDLSVADSCFWDLFRKHRGTTLAGVPYTFDLLDRVGFASMRLPHLRYVTQAGGRLAPDRVARYAALGQRNGWDLFVMYGQTEATARMAYLPPDLAESHPQAIGVPIPGGSFRLEPVAEWPEPDTGELVYSGPNVMLGYAERPADLRLGRTVQELHTGDVARRCPDGLFELVGRRSRFAKILGLRIDLQRVEAMLEEHGADACCLDGDNELAVAVAGTGDPRGVQRLVSRACALPARAVRVSCVPELPRLATGKPDYEALREAIRPNLAEPAAGAPAAGALPAGERPAAGAPPAGERPMAGERPAPGTPPAGEGPAPAADPERLCRLYVEILDRSDVTPDSSFVSLGGDSLSYVEMSIRLEQALGHLPADWHTLPIRELRRPAREAARWRRRLETSVALRAIAIVLIVGSHVPVFMIKGGAHVLLGVAGFNFARFHLTAAARPERVRHIGRSIGRVALPSVAWIGLALLLTTDYRPTNLFLLNSVFGPPDGRSEWHFWFIEALVYILIGMAALLALPRLDRAERRFPFAFPMALAVLGLISRYDLFGLDARYDLPSAIVAFWIFALGWAAAKATGVRDRLLVTAAIVATVPGFFGEPQREVVIIAGLALLVWVPNLPSLAPLNRLAGVLAASSLYIYLTHWQVFPRVSGESPILALAASLAFGVGYWAFVTRISGWLAPVARWTRRPRRLMASSEP